MQLENDALHTEVAQLTRQVEQQCSQLDLDRKQFFVTVSEMEQQLQSMAVGYLQVEQTAEVLKRDNEKLVIAKEAAERVRGQDSSGAGSSPEDQCLSLEREAGVLRQHIEALQAEKTDLFDVFGQVIRACPDAAHFVAPLGVPIGRPSSNSDGGRLEEMTKPVL